MYASVLSTLGLRESRKLYYSPLLGHVVATRHTGARPIALFPFRYSAYASPTQLRSGGTAHTAAQNAHAAFTQMYGFTVERPRGAGGAGEGGGVQSSLGGVSSTSVGGVSTPSAGGVSSTSVGGVSTPSAGGVSSSGGSLSQDLSQDLSHLSQDLSQWGGVVHSVSPDSPAERAGLREGDTVSLIRGGLPEGGSLGGGSIGGGSGVGVSRAQSESVSPALSISVRREESPDAPPTTLNLRPEVTPPPLRSQASAFFFSPHTLPCFFSMCHSPIFSINQLNSTYVLLFIIEEIEVALSLSLSL